jgi:hypothetical protein
MLTAGIIVAIMILPIVTSVSREVLRSVPNLQREAAYALGATRWEVTSMAVLSYAKTGLFGAGILGLGRALGETMAVAVMSLDMLRDAITAFIERQPAKARAAIPRDGEVDELNRQLHRELASFMIERPTTISRCLSLMVVSKSLERVADHATNIAEEVVFLYEAVDIRHSARKGE